MDAPMRASLLGPTPAAPFGGRSPLQWSIARGDLDSSLVLAGGAAALVEKLDLQDPDHAALLPRVLDRATPAEARAVLGTRRGPHRQTLLHAEAAAGRAGSVEALVAHGADVHDVDAQGRTPLALALASAAPDTPAIVAVLLTAGADPDADDGKGRALLSVALERAPAAAVSRLIEAFGGSEMPAVAAHWPTWLAAQLHVERGQARWTPRTTDLLRTLLDHGANIAQHTLPNGDSILLAGALRSGDPELLERALDQLDLLPSSPDVSAQLARHVRRWLGNPTWSPGQRAELQVLLRHGLDARLSAPDREGVPRELLSLAASQGDLPMVRQLLERGAPVDAATRDGITACGYAARARQKDVYDLLVAHGASERNSWWRQSHWQSPP
jgi:hypothetical protein